MVPTFLMNSVVFLALDSWMDCVSRISLKKYHKTTKDSKALFQSSSDVSKHLLDIIWDNRDDMVCHAAFTPSFVQL